MAEPAILKRGKIFQKIVQQDFEKNTEGGGVFSESHISFTNYNAVKKQRGRIDIFIKDKTKLITILEIKATDWDKIKRKNIRRNLYRHQKQLFGYVYKYLDIDKLEASYGIIYPAPPKNKDILELINDISENDYCFPAYWYTELNENFDVSILG